MRYEQQLEEVKQVLEENRKTLTEKEIIKRLFDIRNTALLRLETCNKFAWNHEAQEKLGDHINEV